MEKTKETPRRFACTGCGKCCTGDPRRYWIETTRAEQQRIAQYLGISMAWLRRRYVVREPGAEGLTMRGGRCNFLDGGNRCRIYEVRPTQCRTYPFWPELLSSRSAWRQEAKRCEGIGQGETIATDLIKKILKRSAVKG